ncbi:TPA: hypothetical protein DIV45_01050 [Patescibacteria group bacterium]|nr:hypothetical protein [Patescibacteria group bacterium]
MDIIILIMYLLLLGLVAAYSGVIAYHTFKYRHQLPNADAQKATGMLWAYLLVGGVIVALSLIGGFIYWWTA